VPYGDENDNMPVYLHFSLRQGPDQVLDGREQVMCVCAREKKEPPLSAFRRRPKGYGGHSEVAPGQRGHTIGRPFLTRRSAAKPVGPGLLLLEEPVGRLMKKEELVPTLHRDDTTEAATRLTRRRAPQEARALRALHELTTVDRARATCKARCMTRQRGL
jgi:hypothetical protein